MRSLEFGIRNSEYRWPRAAQHAGAMSIPHSAFRTPHSPRRAGISLMEVLISIFIMAIGMVSIASLLPVGGIQVQKANVEEQKAICGLNAQREFQIRGMANSANWVQCNTSTNPAKWVTYTGAPAAYVPPLAIDPLMVGSVVAANAQDSKKIDTFPANVNSASYPVMKRLTIATACNASGAAPNITFTPVKALSDAIFRAADDIVGNQPSDRNLPATGQLTIDSSGNPVKRDFDGGYTWLATLTPYYPDQAAPLPMNQFTLSIVIFYRRVISTPTASSQQEDYVHCTAAGSPGTEPTAGTVSFGGGDLNFGDATAATEQQINMTRPGNWIMLCRNDATLGRVFKWYRIVAASTDTSGNLGATLSGPDWVWGGGANPTYACLFDGAVACYQRVIHLDGPSLWQ
jgi:Tfp pilus assembly protein PilV